MLPLLTLLLPRFKNPSYAPVMAAIFCHVTSKLLVQIKDNEINMSITFCPSISQCLGDIALLN